MPLSKSKILILNVALLALLSEGIGAVNDDSSDGTDYATRLPPVIMLFDIDPVQQQRRVKRELTTISSMEVLTPVSLSPHPLPPPPFPPSLYTAISNLIKLFKSLPAWKQGHPIKFSECRWATIRDPSIGKFQLFGILFIAI